MTGNAEVVDAYRGVHKRSHPCHREERKPHRIRKVPSRSSWGEEKVEDYREILTVEVVQVGDHEQRSW